MVYLLISSREAVGRLSWPPLPLEFPRIDRPAAQRAALKCLRSKRSRSRRGIGEIGTPTCGAALLFRRQESGSPTSSVRQIEEQTEPRNSAAAIREWRTDMADDRSKRGPQDRSRINLSEDYEVRYWSKKFRVTPDLLRAAVEKVGTTADAVEKELKAA